MNEFISEFSKQLFITMQSFSFFLLVGFVIASLLRIMFKPSTIQKFLGKRNFFTVFIASLIGVPMPLCSCSVIPVAISIRKSGASDGATLSFMTSTPVTGVDSISISFALLPPPLAFARPIVAFALGLITGAIQVLFFKDPNQPKNIQINSDKKSFAQNFKEAIQYTFNDLFPSLANALFWGVILSGLLLTMISLQILPDLATVSSGSKLLDMVIMVMIGIPIYVCATGSTPIAAALIAGGMSPGLAFVFLVAGPATNITTLLAIKSHFGLRSTIMYVSIIIIGSIATGLLLDTFFLNAYQQNMQDFHNHDSYTVIDKIAAIVLALWFVYHYGQGLKAKFKPKSIPQSNEVKLHIPKMVCQNCLRKITNAAEEIGSTVKTADLKEKLVVFALPANLNNNDLQNKLNSIGFETSNQQ